MPAVLVGDIAQGVGRDLGRAFVLRSPGIGARIGLAPLDDADHALDAGADPVDDEVGLFASAKAAT